MASRRTKLGLDDKPWSFNRVGLERAGGHKFKFSYGTIGEAMEQLSVENKDRRTEGVIQVSQVSLWVCLFRFFFFAGGWGSTENVSADVKLLKGTSNDLFNERQYYSTGCTEASGSQRSWKGHLQQLLQTPPPKWCHFPYHHDRSRPCDSS